MVIYILWIDRDMERYEELVKLLEIENQEWEKSILELWILRDGIDVVYKECLKIIKNPGKVE